MLNSTPVVHRVASTGLWQNGAGRHARHLVERYRLQGGFSLIEISIVTAIVLLISIIAIPAIGSYVIENKVPKVGEELARFVLQTQVNARPGAVSPYTDVATVHLANMVLDSSLFSVLNPGGSPTVYHGLGRDGTVEVGAADAGASLTITMDKVNHAACPALASVMQRLVHTITISSPVGGSAIVKGPGVDYSALNAESRCAKGDVNSFVFHAG